MQDIVEGSLHRSYSIRKKLLEFENKAIERIMGHE
jgi:hypothetical protein